MMLYFISTMRVTPTNIIPITEARSILGDLTEAVKGENYVILTKSGSPKAAIVDIDYLARLEKAVTKIYEKTFIDPKLLPFTREFSSEEIEAWNQEDVL